MRNRLLMIFGGLFVFGLILSFFGVGMTREDLHISAAAEPLGCLGGERIGEFCSPGTILPITNALVMTILVDLLLVLTIIFGARNMQLIPRGFQNLVEVVIEVFYNFAQGIDRKNVAKFFPLPATIFIFFLVANMAALVPGVGSIGMCVPREEAHNEAQATPSEGATNAPPAEGTAPADQNAETAAQTETSAFANIPGYCGGNNFIIPFLRAPAADLNVTFAFALVTMFMVEFFGFQALGGAYLTKFFNFREGAMGVFIGIIELVSELSRIISFAFRIFGNIFGGEVILVVMSFLFPYLLPLPFYGFEVFVALIQAVIFAVLALIFFQLATIGHGGHDEHGHEEPVVQIESDVRREPAH